MKKIMFIIQAVKFLRISWLLLCLPLTSYASQTIFTIQTGSFVNESDAQKQFDSIKQGLNEKDLDYLRIEKIGDYYSVRIGNYNNQATAEKYLQAMSPHLSEALIRKAYLIDERIRRIYNASTSSLQLIYTIQTGSFNRYEDAQNQFDSIKQGFNGKDLDYLRIEKIGDYYSIRIGNYNNKATAEKYLQAMSPHLPGALITKAYIKDERVKKIYKGYLSFDTPEAGEEPSSDPEPVNAALLENEQSVNQTETEMYAAGSPSFNTPEAGEEPSSEPEPVNAAILENEQSVNQTETEMYAAASPSFEASEGGEEPSSEPEPVNAALLENEQSVNQTETEMYAAASPSFETPEGGEEPSSEPEPVNAALLENEQPVNQTETEMNSESQENINNTYAENDSSSEIVELDLEGLDILESEGDQEYKFPEIKPEVNLSLGYRFSGNSGLDRAFEYEDSKNFPAFSLDYVDFHYPHRTHFDTEFKTENDYMMDLRYAYKSTLNARLFRNAIYHNLEDIELIDLDSSISPPGIIINDENDKFWVRSGINQLNLKLKKADYPTTHAYINAFQFQQKGSRQQRSMAGSGYFNNIQRLSRTRNTDQITAKYEIGANSHLGPVEVDFSHVEKRFDVYNDDKLYDSYTATASRPAGIFPHNQLSELKSSSNKFRIHTNYAGRLVATASFAMKERENRASGASEDIFIGEGAVRWMPLLRLSLFLNYSHTDIDPDNPATASITDSTGSTTTYSTPVKPSVATTTDTIALTAKYRPESFLTLKAKYLYKHITRENTELWNLRDSSRKNVFTFTSDAKIKKGLTVKAIYRNKSVDKPSYNSEPYFSNKGSVTVTWLPSPGINLFLDVSAERGERTELDYAETAEARERDIKTDSLQGSGTFQVLNNLSLSTSYAYFRYKVKQDIVYEDLGGIEVVDSGVPYTDSAHVFSVSLNYMPVDKLHLLGQITHTRTEGEFEPKSTNLTDPISIASFSKHELTHTVYHVTGDYNFAKGLSCSIDMKYMDVDDVLDNIHNSDEDADAYLILLRVIKKWG